MGTALAVVPARYDSRRLPGKALADIAGLPLVEHVRRRTFGAGFDVVVATDDDRIAAAVAPHGRVVRTGAAPNGTSRVAEAVEQLGWAGPVLNVQGDMPLIAGEHLAAVAHEIAKGAAIATLAVPIPLGVDPGDGALVKVVLDPTGRALYFSRAPIPHGGPFLVHIGVYGFAPGILQRAVAARPGALARSEDLEQLAWLEDGLEITVAVVEGALPPSVDTPSQLQAVRRLFQTGAAALP